MADLTYRRLATAVLVAHQRRDATSCLCGWANLGHSHAEHVAEVLDQAGALRDAPPPSVRWVTCAQCGKQYDPERPRETHPYRHPPGGFRPGGPVTRGGHHDG